MGKPSADIEEFDVVIVGGGTASCVLANRLSEDPNISVLVLEAGEDRRRDARVYTPGLVPELLGNPDYDWQYVSEPEPGINGRTMAHPRGKMLGGSSAINSFALIYPSAAGIDAWADLGNDGWSWEDTKEYFSKFQTVLAPHKDVKDILGINYADNSIETTNGPVHANFPASVSDLQMAWIEEFRSLGLENTADPIHGKALGGYISTNHITSGKRERSHAGVAYLELAQSRPNLRVTTGALVQRIIFDNQQGHSATATGVEYVQNGNKLEAMARKEVLLAAGAFASPQILELSGIGDKDLLQKHGIRTVYNNANVGENLQDHIRCGLSWELKDGADARNILPPSEAGELYESKRPGPWDEKASYTFAYLPFHPFFASGEQERLSHMFDEHLSDSSLPDFQLKRNDFIRKMLFSPTEATATAFLSRRPVVPDVKSRKFFTLYAMLSHSFSRGNVHITSSDSSDKPKIDFAYYDHPLDLEVHARHLRTLQKLAMHGPLAFFKKGDGVTMPPELDAAPITIEASKNWLKERAMTNYHPCGTCSMMPESIGGVVDSKLRVYGTKNVRVVDASIMPIIPRGNIITTVYAVAEKAADIISTDLSIQRTT